MIRRPGPLSLRFRLALADGISTTLAILVVGVAVWLTVAMSLRSATDADLHTTAEAFRAVDLSEAGRGEANERSFDELDLFIGSERPDLPYIQLLGPGGEKAGNRLPVSEAARSVANGEADEAIETVKLRDRSIRVLTIPLTEVEGGGALRVGTDVTNTTDGLRRARVGSLIAGVLAGFAMTTISWFAAGPLLAPIAAVANAADRLRRNNELPERIEGEGHDELGRLVVSFNALLDELHASRERQRRLVADVSHELRTPLTSLRVKIEFIQGEPGLDNEQRERLIEGAVADLSALTDLVSELVELASEGASPERAELVELGTVVEQAAQRFRLTSGRNVEISTTSGMVETRPKQVERALSNLLTNADKYSPADTLITVTQVGVRIEVRDRGPGIPIAERDRVFERFHRGDNARPIDGTGLGLAIVAAVARTNSGTVWIRDPEDGGPGVVVGLSVGATPEK